MNNFKKVLPFILIVFLLLVIKNNIAFIMDFMKNGNALSALEKNYEAERKKNTYLRERLHFVKTDQFVKDEAQSKLGMLATGEYFVIAPTATPLDNRTFDFEEKPNWRKWAELFF